jgi:hypothetical protein
MFLLCVWLTVPRTAFAAIYWVSPAGQSAWAGCRSDAPLNGTAACSIGTANTNASAGDTVYLRGGTYSENIFIAPTNSGTATSRITFRAYNDEAVNVNQLRLPNNTHETGAWASWNGAAVEHSSTRAWDGTYSTKFTAVTQGQGVRSDAFNLVREAGGIGYLWTFRVYSEQAVVHLEIRTTDGTSIPLDSDYTLVPNQWNTLHGYMTIARTADYYVVFTAPASTTSGTWYVDGLYLHGYQSPIYLSGKSYITVSGVNVESAATGFTITKGGDYNEISGSTFANMRQYVFENNSIWNGNGAPSRYNWIHDNVFRDGGYVQRVASATSCNDSQTLLGVGGSAPDTSNYNLIENNRFYHGGHDLVIIRTQFNTFRNNILHNEGWMENREGPCQDVDGIASTFNNPSHFGNRGLLFENPGNAGGHNLVEGNRIGFSGTPADDDGANGIENPSDYNIFRYNFLYKNGAAGFYFKAQPGVSGVDVLPDNNVVYNNTIYKNGGGQDIYVSEQTGLYFVCGSVYTPTRPTGNVVKNNIVFDNATAVRHIDCEGYTYVSNFEQDPLFLNADLTDPFSTTLPDLRLQVRSPAIDGAEALTTVKSDDAGTGTTVAVVDARFFQDGSWGPPGKVQPDVLAIGRTGNAASIVSIDYVNNLIRLSASLTRAPGDQVWLSKKSDGAKVLAGAGPDFGASEFGVEAPAAPANVRIVR